MISSTCSWKAGHKNIFNSNTSLSYYFLFDMLFDVSKLLSSLGAFITRQKESYTRIQIQFNPSSAILRHKLIKVRVLQAIKIKMS